MAKRPTPRLSKARAIELADSMLPHIQREVYWGLEIEVAMEAANDVVQGGYRGKTFYGANTFNVVVNALAIELSLVLAKLFEIPSPRPGRSAADRFNRSDIASIPLLVRLLRQKQCCTHYVSLSMDWEFGIGKAMNGEAPVVARTAERLISRYGSARRSPKYQVAMKRIRDFRNIRVAHSLMIQPTMPIYKDLHMLMDLARETLQDMRLVMKGEAVDLLEKESIRRREAAHFWAAALPAAIVADK